MKYNSNARVSHPSHSQNVGVGSIMAPPRARLRRPPSRFATNAKIKNKGTYLLIFLLLTKKIVFGHFRANPPTVKRKFRRCLQNRVNHDYSTDEALAFCLKTHRRVKWDPATGKLTYQEAWPTLRPPPSFATVALPTSTLPPTVHFNPKTRYIHSFIHAFIRSFIH